MNTEVGVQPGPGQGHLQDLNRQTGGGVSPRGAGGTLGAQLRRA